jgi:hypothetical protein
VLALVVMVLGGLFLARRGEAPSTTPSSAGIASTSTVPARAAATPVLLTVAPTAIGNAPTAATAPTPTTAATVLAAPTASKPTTASQPTAELTHDSSTPTTASQLTGEPTAEPTADPRAGAVLALVNGTPQVLGAGAPLPTTPPVDWWNDVRPVQAGQADDIHRAFNRFWEIRVQANYDLNPELLTQVMAGAALQRERTAIDDLRAQNRAVQMSISHDISVLHVSPDEAAIEDDYTSDLTYVDAETKEPVRPTPIDKWEFAYRLRKLDGVWKVVDSVRLTSE